MRRLLPFLLLLLVLAGCRPPSTPNFCLPDSFIQSDCVEQHLGDLPEADLAVWWQQFDDNLLTSLIERGLCCNYDLRIAREKICEARAVFGMDFSILLPRVDAFVLFDRMRNSQTRSESLFTGGQYVNFYQMGFDSIWELDLFGKNLDRARAAAYDVTAAYEEVRNVHVTVASEIAIQYFKIRTLQERIAITEDHIKAEAELLELVTDLEKAGLISELDVHLSKGLLQERLSALPKFELELYQTIYALAVLTGDLPENLLSSFCETKPLPCTEARFPLGFPSELLCRRGDVRQAEFEMRAAGARVLSARKEFFPTISLDSLYSYATGFFTSWTKLGSREWNVMPSLTLPLFHGGEILAHIRFETSLQKQAVLNYELKVLEAVEEVESALVGYFYQGARIHSLREQVKAYRDAREIAFILYQSGIVDFLFVIDTERDLFLSQILEAESKEELMTQMVSVYKALGGGWECCD